MVTAVSGYISATAMSLSTATTNNNTQQRGDGSRMGKRTSDREHTFMIRMVNKEGGIIPQIVKYQ